MNLNLEKIFLLFFLAAALFMGMANIFSAEISHPYPYAYFASDPFIHYLTTESLKENGNFLYVSKWYTANQSNVEYCLPPQNYMMSAGFSFNSGLQGYDSIYFISIIAAVINSFVVYLMIRKVSKNAALIALPFMLIVFSKVFISSFTWGQWQATVAYMFFSAALWALTEIKRDYMFVLFAVFASASFLAHYPEFIFLAVFMLLYIAARFFFRELSMDEVRKLALAAVLIFVLIFWELLRFYGIWVKGTKNELGSSELSLPVTGIPVPSFMDFTVILVALIFVGAVFALMMIRKERQVILLYALFVLAMWWSNYLGITKRTVTLRYFAPVVLAVLIGIGIYYLLKNFLEWKPAYSISLSVVLVFGVVYFFMTPTGSPGWMIQERWDAMSWIRENTPETATVLYFYGDGYEQHNPLASTKRINYRLLADSMIEAAQKGEIRRNYTARDVTGMCSAMEPYRKSLLEYGFYAREKPNVNAHQNVDICSFQYYFIERASGRIPPLAQYNVAIGNELIAHGATPVFNNRLVTVLKNNNLGVNCVGNTT